MDLLILIIFEFSNLKIDVCTKPYNFFFSKVEYRKSGKAILYFVVNLHLNFKVVIF